MTELSKMERQLKLEDEMRGMGIARFREEVRKAQENHMESNTSGVLRIMQFAFEPLCKSIEDWKTKCEAGKASAGRPSESYKFLKEIRTDVLAFLTMKTVMDYISHSRSLTHVTLGIATQIQNEINFKEFKDESRAHYEKVKQNVTKKTRKASHIATVLKRSAKKDDVDLTKYTVSDKHKIGSCLLSLFIESTGLVEIYTAPQQPGKRRRKNSVVQPTQQTTEWLKENNARCELLSPIYMPMLVEPKDWKRPYGGGFWSENLNIAFVRKATSAHLEELENLEMWEVYQSVNHMQKTPWKINKRVLEIVRICSDNKVPLGSLPAGQEIPLPPQPDDIATNHDARWQWRKKASLVYGENVRSRSKFIDLQKKLQVAERFQDETQLFFVYSCDFRGRIYPVQNHLNPQGDDVAKSLLTFAVGKALNDETSAWLALHGANLYGFDKVGLQERVEWTKANEQQILEVARDPLRNQWWAEADKPWQFLAFCFEWQEFTENPEGFVSHLPVALDGSCNGLQNFSAMLRDPIGGKATNLTPSETPSDIYQQVAELVDRKVNEDIKNGVPFSAAWKGFINRKLVKRPTMTMPYGATLTGYREQIAAEVQAWKDAGQHAPSYESSGFHECLYLAQLIQKSLGEVVVAAKQAMSWLQDVADVVCKEKLPIYWTTAVGFPVMQNYRNVLTKQVRTEIAGRFYNARVAYDTGVKIDKRKMKASISPNFVHSCDAAHLVRTVNLCESNNIASLSMVHDSFATHAADTPALREILRHAFVQIHETDPIGTFYEAMKRQTTTPDLVPPPPEKGDLDLKKVLEADFFFA